MTIEIDYNIRDNVYWANHYNPFIARGVHKTTIAGVSLDVKEYNESIGLYDYDVRYRLIIDGIMVAVYPDEIFNTREEAEAKLKELEEQYVD